MCQDACDAPAQAQAHRRHSMVLVPVGTPGVELVRNIHVLHHHAPEGHCEIRLHNVRVPATALLGDWGQGFAMAQARLGPGRVHHCMRTIGQCELALQLAAERALERHAFGKPLSEQANVQEWLADSRIEIDQARWLVLHAAWNNTVFSANSPISLPIQSLSFTLISTWRASSRAWRAMSSLSANGTASSVSGWVSSSALARPWWYWSPRCLKQPR